MSANQESLERQVFLWPLGGLVLGALVAINPFYKPDLTLAAGVAAWFVSFSLAMLLSLHPVTARVGVLVTGLFMAMPCFLREPPLLRGLLMCCMAFPFVVVALPLSIGPSAGLRERLEYCFTWLGTREVRRRTRTFDAMALLRLVMSTAVFAAALACVKAFPTAGYWLLGRWLGGGIMILAWAEMATACHDFLTALLGLSAPSLMRSPHLSTSIHEFWSVRWNPASSVLLFRKYFFAPWARRGAALALFGAFLFSAAAHVALFYMATGRWGISVVNGAFFLVQPLPIFAERWMNVRRWRRPAQHAWTISALAVTSPLFVEPAIQLLEPSWGPPGQVLLPTIAVLIFVFAATAFVAVGSLLVASEPTLSSTALRPTAAAESG